jgi:hypothetical protein
VSLPPYTVPDHDADLWDCGVVLSDAEPKTWKRGEVRAHVERLLLLKGPRGFSRKAELMRACPGLGVCRVETALRDLGVQAWMAYRHPSYAEPDERSEREDSLMGARA